MQHWPQGDTIHTFRSWCCSELGSILNFTKVIIRLYRSFVYCETLSKFSRIYYRFSKFGKV
jgi:hypothetical protein